ncbi:MAG: hypothetical protein ACSHX6_14300 [Akkermansiaceae bacterium]
MSLKDLHRLTTQFISSPDGQFTDSPPLALTQLFLDIFHRQHQENTAYRKFCDLSITPPIQSINNIPALPTDAFKLTPNPTSLTPEEITTTFLTSGTTTETKGSHHFSTTHTYETSILQGWKYCQLPKLHPNTFILTPTTAEAPHSSLSHMMETLKQHLSPSATFILSNGTLDHQHIIDCANSGTPVTLLGTALAFLQLFETLESLPTIQLPPGSWALETGGYKGSKKSLTKEELYQKFRTHLNIPQDHIWNEYSMTELSSQFYTSGIGNPHIAPPWTQIKVINPETNLPVKSGEIGYLVIYDLANIDSVLAIRTQDLAIFHDSQSFTLIGRDPSALPRGCSRSL